MRFAFLILATTVAPALGGDEPPAVRGHKAAREVVPTIGVIAGGNLWKVEGLTAAEANAAIAARGGRVEFVEERAGGRLFVVSAPSWYKESRSAATSGERCRRCGKGCPCGDACACDAADRRAQSQPVAPAYAPPPAYYAPAPGPILQGGFQVGPVSGGVCVGRK